MIPPERLKKGPTISFWKLFLIFVITLAIFAGMILIFLANTSKPTVNVKPITDIQIASLMKDDEVMQNGHVQFQLRCARCHGTNLDGGLEGPSLVDDTTLYGESFESLHRVITLGVPVNGMPSWGNQLLEEDLQALTIYIIKMKAFTKTQSKR